MYLAILFCMNWHSARSFSTREWSSGSCSISERASLLASNTIECVILQRTVHILPQIRALLDECFVVERELEKFFLESLVLGACPQQRLVGTEALAHDCPDSAREAIEKHVFSSI